TRTSELSGSLFFRRRKGGEAPLRGLSGSFDRGFHRTLGEHAAEVRLVLDGALQVGLHVDAFGALLRRRFDRAGAGEVLAGQPGLDAFRADRLRAGTGDTDARLAARSLPVRRDHTLVAPHSDVRAGAW